MTDATVSHNNFKLLTERALPSTSNTTFTLRALGCLHRRQLGGGSCRKAESRQSPLLAENIWAETFYARVVHSRRIVRNDESI